MAFLSSMRKCSVCVRTSEDIPQRRGRNWRKIQDVLRQNAEDFCLNTSLHGLKYLANKRVDPIERKFIILSLVAVILLSGYFIQSVYENWNNNPIIVSVNSKPTFITTLPFPAVTICNLNQASQKKIQAFSADSVEYTLLKMLCEEEFNETIAASITSWNNLSQFIADVSSPCSEMLLECHFGAVAFNCPEIFRPVLTDEGLCCSFNLVHPKYMFTSRHHPLFNVAYPAGYEPIDWDAEHGYPSVLPEKYIPMSTPGSGLTLGLTLLLDTRVQDYHCSVGNSVGFKIFIHDPSERPNMRETGLLISPGKETNVRLRSQLLQSDQSLRALDRKVRHCVFQDEVKLLYYAHYTQANCEMECEAILSWKLCGCISYFLPRVYENAAICNIYNFSCVEKAHMRVILATENEGCHRCLPSCNDLTYFPHFFSTPLRSVPYRPTSVVSRFPLDYLEENIAVVKINFKKNLFRSYRQREFISFTTFLASVGGLMGLFLGFSLISLVECFYYGFIRLSRQLYRVMHKSRSKAKLAAIKLELPSAAWYPSDFGTAYSRRLGLSKRRPLQLQQLRRQLVLYENAKEAEKTFVSKIKT